jgi:hypothetical protein
MHIKKIAEEILDEFPDLKEKGYTAKDINIVNRYYFESITDQLLNNTDDIFISLKSVGYFATDDKRLKSYLTRVERALNYNYLKIDEALLGKSVGKKLINIENLVNTKKNYSNDKLLSLNKYEDTPLTRYNQKIFQNKVSNYEDVLKRIYDIKTIARNMEEQKTNS